MAPDAMGPLCLNAGRDASDVATTHYCGFEARCGSSEDARCLGGYIWVDGTYECASALLVDEWNFELENCGDVSVSITRRTPSSIIMDTLTEGLSGKTS